MASKNVETDLQQYVELRTMLDSVEIGSLRYYLNAANQPEQAAHYKYLSTKLRDIINHVWTTGKAITCPDGYVECNGCCVPYTCPGGGNKL